MTDTRSAKCDCGGELVDCMAGTRQCLACGTIIGNPLLACETCGNDTPHVFDFGGYRCSVCKPPPVPQPATPLQLKELYCAICQTHRPHTMYNDGNWHCGGCDSVVSPATVAKSQQVESSEPEQSVGTQDVAATQAAVVRHESGVLAVAQVPRLDAQEALIFRSLSAKSRSVIADLAVDKRASIALNRTLNNSGCLREIPVAPNMKPLYALSERGERFARHLKTAELERARDRLGAKRNAAATKQRNTKDIVCPEDVAPFAALVSDVFYSGKLWADLSDSQRKFIIKHVNIIRKQYSVEDCEYAWKTWLPKQDWKNTSLAAFTNGKDWIGIALSERKKATDKTVWQIVPDETINLDGDSDDN